MFVPSCDARGKFLDSGCVHPRVPGKMPTCYCATPDGQMVGEVIQLVTPPEGCDGDKPHGNGTTGRSSDSLIDLYGWLVD